MDPIARSASPLVTRHFVGAIVSSFASFLDLDERSKACSTLKYSRACVEIDVSIDIPTEVKISLPDGRSFWQAIEIEGNLHYCAHCKIHGHSLDKCRKIKHSQQAEQITEVAKLPKSLNEKNEAVEWTVVQKRKGKKGAFQKEQMHQDNQNGKEPTIASNSISHDRLKLHLPKHFCQLPLMNFPSDFPQYPSKQQFISYMESYAAHFDIKPQFNQAVIEAAFDQASGLWNVTYEDSVYLSRWLIVATGENAEAMIPEINGLEKFQGIVKHTSFYKSGFEFEKQKLRNLVAEVEDESGFAEVGVGAY
ncbi:hypothetical protein QQ045_026280 [Rhodiola kirilowii]